MGIKKKITLATAIAAFIGGIYCIILHGQETPLLFEAIAKKDPVISTRLKDMNQTAPMPLKFDNFLMFGIYYRDELIATAAKYNLPPQLLFAVFQPELMAQNRFGRLGDDIATYIPYWNPSIGLGQIRIGIARELSTEFGDNLDRNQIVKLLNTPEGAIEYVARYLRRTIDSKVKNAEGSTLLMPENLVQIYAEYVGGRDPSTEAQLVSIGIIHPFTQAVFYEAIGGLTAEERTCMVLRARMFSDEIRPWSEGMMLGKRMVPTESQAWVGTDMQKAYRDAARAVAEKIVCDGPEFRSRVNETKKRTDEYAAFIRELNQSPTRRPRRHYRHRIG